MGKLENRLLSLGVMPNLVGFGYAIDAINYINDSGCKNMTEIYKYVANKNGVKNYSCIERGIRHAITKVNIEKWKELGGIRKSNSEFLHVIALVERTGK